MRVERGSGSSPGMRVMTETLLDLRAVEELRGVFRAEAERELRVVQRLAAAPVAGERPGEHVVAVDRRPFALRLPGERQRRPQADPVVDVEQRRFEVRADTVCGEQAT